MTASLAAGGGRRLWLKWHELRRKGDDPAHQRANLEAGLAEGASLEVDITLTRDGHFVCLHDDELSVDTTGSGPVQEADRAAVARLYQKDGAGRPLEAPPLFLDEVVGALARLPADWPGMFQLDLKTAASGLDARAIERFRTLVAPVARHLVLGGTDWPAVDRLGRGVAGLRLGFDPLDMHEHDPPEDRAAFETLAARSFAIAPDAFAYYFHIPLVLQGLAHGVDLITMAKARGGFVDCWRLEPEDDGADETLARLIAAGADQITTNAPEALAALWEWRQR